MRKPCDCASCRIEMVLATHLRSLPAGSACPFAVATGLARFWASALAIVERNDKATAAELEKRWLEAFEVRLALCRADMEPGGAPSRSCH